MPVHERTHNLCPHYVGRPRRNVLAIVGLHDTVDKHEHLIPFGIVVASNRSVVSVKMTGCDNRTVVSSRVDFAHIRKNRGVRAYPYIAGFHYGRTCSEMKKPKAAIYASIVSLFET